MIKTQQQQNKRSTGQYDPLNIERWFTMIKVRVKRVNAKNEQDFFTTKINFTFLETIEYYLNQNKFHVDLCFLTWKETVWQNVSVELLEV